MTVGAQMFSLMTFEPMLHLKENKKKGGNNIAQFIKVGRNKGCCSSKTL